MRGTSRVDHRWRARTSTIGLTAATVALLVTGCSQGVQNSSQPSGSAPQVQLEDPKPVAPAPVVSRNAALAAEVPAAIRNQGSLKVAISSGNPPLEFGPPGQLQGLSVDLATAISQLLGLKLEIVPGEFATVLPSVSDKRADLGIASITVTSAREANYDFLTYYAAGMGWLVQTGSQLNPGELCGAKVAVVRGTIFESQLDQAAQQCERQSRPLLEVQVVATSPEGANAVLAGNADAIPLDSPATFSFIANSTGALDQAGATTDVLPLGVALLKGSDLVDVVQQAINLLIVDGQYAQLVDRWQIPQGAVIDSQLNPTVP